MLLSARRFPFWYDTSFTCQMSLCSSFYVTVPGSHWRPIEPVLEFDWCGLLPSVGFTISGSTGPHSLRSLDSTESVMAKKTKDDVPNVNSVTNRDIMQRMNFLYQASLYMNSLSTSDSETTSTQGEDKRATTSQISRSYIKTMKVVGKKTVVKLCVRYFPPSLSG